MGLTLEIAAVTKMFGEKLALDRCSFRIRSGMICALMGPNGCGKSTLLKICALLDNATSGAVLYRDDREMLLEHDQSLRRRMSMVLARVGPFNDSVLRNVSYGLRVRGLRRSNTEDLARKALDTVGLADKAGQSALTLSSGELQRLGLARALAINPEILFLDEPTASIDEENTAIVEQIILHMAQRGDTTIIFSTHDRDQAVRLAQASLTMRSGRIVEQKGLALHLDTP